MEHFRGGVKTNNSLLRDNEIMLDMVNDNFLFYYISFREKLSPFIMRCFLYWEI